MEYIKRKKIPPTRSLEIKYLAMHNFSCFLGFFSPSLQMYFFYMDMYFLIYFYKDISDFE